MVEVLEISKFKQDEEMKQDIQVGDVWVNNGSDSVKTIIAIHKGIVVTSYISDNDHIFCTTTRDQDIVKFYTLVERDGKPVREFEEGAFYPVHIINASIPHAVLQYSKGKFWPNQYFVMSIDDADIVSARECELSYIGEKLEITWPEV